MKDLPEPGTKHRALYDSLQALAARGAAVDLDALKELCGEDLPDSVYRARLQQLIKLGHIRRSSDGLRDQALIIVATGARVPVITQRRAPLNHAMIDEAVYQSLCTSAENGTPRAFAPALGAQLGVSASVIEGSWRRLIAAGRMERRGGPLWSAYIPALDKLAHPAKPMPGQGFNYQDQSEPARAVRDAAKAAAEARLEQLRTGVDACWYCANPLNRGDHSRCGAAARVTYLPRVRAEGAQR